MQKKIFSKPHTRQDSISMKNLTMALNDENNTPKEEKLFSLLLAFIWIATPLFLIWYCFFYASYTASKGIWLVVSSFTAIGFALAFKILREAFRS
jgi:RsiW-degrading membrane proteinase PrsW (M82 family)